MAAIATVRLSDKTSRSTQGWFLVVCPLLGICALAVLAYVDNTYTYSNDWLFEGLLQLTGILFGLWIALLFVAGLISLVDARRESR